MPLPWTAFAITDRGRKRARNEDAFLLSHDPALLAVADGMGGHAAGEIASALAIERAADVCLASLAAGPSPGALEQALRDAVLTAHRAIVERSAREPEKAGMGTTLTLLAWVPGRDDFRIAHVGDSRAYLLRGGRLRRLTTDHTLAEERVSRGELSPRRARDHPLSSILTRALGAGGEEPPVDLLAGELERGDLLLLCSDGLTGMVDEDDLQALLERSVPLEELAESLVEAANLRGGLDNITAVLVRAAA